MSWINNDFKSHWNDNKKPTLVKSVLDTLVSNHKPLVHFKEYLESVLDNDLDGDNITATIKDVSMTDSFQAIQQFIKGKVNTVLLLDGSYDDSDAIYGYLPTTKASLDKSNVLQIMSQAATKSEMVRAVQSTPLFKQCATYDELKEWWDNNRALFTLTENVGFASLSPQL